MIRGSDVEEGQNPVYAPLQTLLAYKGAVLNVVHSHRTTPAARHETFHVHDFDHESANVQTTYAFNDVSGRLDASGKLDARNKKDNIGWCESCFSESSFIPLLFCCCFD